MKQQPMIVDARNRINTSIIFGKCKKVDTILFKIVGDEISCEHRRFELNDQNNMVLINESNEKLMRYNKSNSIKIKNYKDKETCPFETSIKVSIRYTKDGNRNLNIKLEKAIETIESSLESERKIKTQKYKEKINSQCLFGNIIITGSSYLPIITYSEDQMDSQNFDLTTELSTTKFNSLNIPVQISETYSQTKVTECFVEKPEVTLEKKIKKAIIDDYEKIEYDKKGEVIGYENTHTGIKMKLKKRKYGYTEEIYFDNKLLSFIDAENSPNINRYSRRLINYIESIEIFKKDNVAIIRNGPDYSSKYRIYNITPENKYILAKQQNILNYNFYDFNNANCRLFYGMGETTHRHNIEKTYGRGYNDEKIKLVTDGKAITINFGNNSLYIDENIYELKNTYQGKQYYNKLFYISYNDRFDYTDYNFSARIIKNNRNRVSFLDFKSEKLNNNKKIYIRDMFGIPRLITNRDKFDSVKSYIWDSSKIFKNIIHEYYNKYDICYDIYNCAVEYFKNTIGEFSYFDFNTGNYYKITDYIKKLSKGDTDAKIEIVDILGNHVGFVEK